MNIPNKEKVTREKFVHAVMDVMMFRMSKVIAAKEQKCPVALLSLILRKTSKAIHTRFEENDNTYIETMMKAMDYLIAIILNGLALILQIATFGLCEFPKSGTGKFIHFGRDFNKKSKQVVYPNHDALYSIAILDLKDSDATIILPKADEMSSNADRKRYQSFVVEAQGCLYPVPVIENKIGYPTEYTLTMKAVGSRFCAILVRTQVRLVCYNYIITRNSRSILNQLTI